VVVGGLGALLGIVLGPFLAGLTLSVPAGDPILGKRWWRGGQATPRRVAVVTGLAAVALEGPGSVLCRPVVRTCKLRSALAIRSPRSLGAVLERPAT